MSVFDRINQEAFRRLTELQNDPGYKALQRLAEEEQRNPGLRLAREMAQRQIEEEQRSPGLRILRERLRQEQSDPVRRIARDLSDETSRFGPLYDISNRSLEQVNRYWINDSLRDWERKIPNWFLKQNTDAASAFNSLMSHFADAQKQTAGFALQSHIDLRNLDQLQALRSFDLLGTELSNLVRFTSPELRDTFLFSTAERLSRIQQIAESHDVTLLDEEFESFLDYITSWIKQAGSKVLSREVIKVILVPVLIAALQQAQSYRWRLSDNQIAEQRVAEQNAKLDALLGALKELEEKATEAAIGKPYLIERTTATFVQPGPRQKRIGYVYTGQSVVAVGSTGRWILIQYTDPINLESRVGWIRKKYAKGKARLVSDVVSENKLRLLLAINFYARGEITLGQAAEVAELSKRAFIDALGERQIPILNYSAEELEEEIGV
jgi:predicted HTH domain antitoxin